MDFISDRCVLQFRQEQSSTRKVKNINSVERRRNVMNEAQIYRLLTYKVNVTKFTWW
jgi:hypothetical protein